MIEPSPSFVRSGWKVTSTPRFSKTLMAAGERSSLISTLGMERSDIYDPSAGARSADKPAGFAAVCCRDMNGRSDSIATAEISAGNGGSEEQLLRRPPTRMNSASTGPRPSRSGRPPMRRRRQTRASRSDSSSQPTRSTPPDRREFRNPQRTRRRRASPPRAVDRSRRCKGTRRENPPSSTRKETEPPDRPAEHERADRAADLEGRADQYGAARCCNPASRAIVGSQVDRKYRFSRFMNITIQSRVVPAARPSAKSCTIGTPFFGCSSTTYSDVGETGAAGSMRLSHPSDLVEVLAPQRQELQRLG